VSMSVIFQGMRLVKASDVVAYEKTVASRSEALRRKVRIGARAFHTHSFLRSQIVRMSAKDRMKYFSRKMLRWFGGLFITLGAMSGLAAVATVSTVAAALVAAGALVATAVSIRASTGYVARIGEMGLDIFATLLGVVQGMRGQTMATWAPAKSR